MKKNYADTVKVNKMTATPTIPRAPVTTTTSKQNNFRYCTSLQPYLDRRTKKLAVGDVLLCRSMPSRRLLNTEASIINTDAADVGSDAAVPLATASSAMWAAATDRPAPATNDASTAATAARSARLRVNLVAVGPSASPGPMCVAWWPHTVTAYRVRQRCAVQTGELAVGRQTVIDDAIRQSVAASDGETATRTRRTLYTPLVPNLRVNYQVGQWGLSIWVMGGFLYFF